MTVLKTILEARKTMTHNESCEYAGTMRKGECPGCSGVGVDLSMGAKDSMSEAVDEIDTADFKLNKAGKKTKAHKIVFRTGEDETQIKDEPTKVHEETTMKKTYKDFADQYIHNESVVPDSMNGKQKPYVSSDGRGNYEVLGNTGQTKATFTRKEHGMAAKDKAMAHVKKNFDAYMKEEIELDEAREYLAVHPKTDKVEHVSDSAEKRDEFIKSKGGMHKPAQTMAGQKKVGDKYMREDVEELDEISTKTLAKAAHYASDPDSDYSYGKSHDAQKFADHAKKTKDAKSAAAVQGAADAKGHYPRPGHTYGYDKIAGRQMRSATPSMVTKKGVLTKNAVQGLKSSLRKEEFADESVDEAYFPDPKDAVSARPTTGRITRTQHRVKTTDTGAIYTKEYDPAGISKGSGAAAAEPKRGRGRPKKDKFAESFAALLAMNETQFDMFAESLSEEAFDAFTAALKV